MAFSLIRRHWAAVVLSVLVGALLILPALWAKIGYGADLNDPVNIRIADEFYYLARIREVLDGYPLSANPYVWEGKSGLPGQPVFLGEYLSAQMIRLTGLDVVGGSVVLDAVLPAAAVLLTYAAFLALTGLCSMAVLGAALLFFIVFPGDFARTVSPQFNFLFWLTEFLLLYLLATRDLSPPRRLLASSAAALNFGLLFYLYTYYWTFYLAFLGLAAALALAARQWTYIRTLAGVAGGGLVIGLPYLWFFFTALGRPEYGETLKRIGLIDTHFPSGLAIVVPAALLFGVLAFLLGRGIIAWDNRISFLAAGAAAAVAVVNQHIITGKNLEFSSHYFMPAAFWLAFFSAYLLAVLASAYNLRRIAAAVAGIAAVAVVGYGLAKSLPPAIILERIELKRFLPILAWLRENTNPDDVVLAPSRLSNLIPIYTSNNVIFAPFLRITALGDEEVLERFAININAHGESWTAESGVRSVLGVQYLDAALHTAQENRVRRLAGLRPKAVDPLPSSAVERVGRRIAELGGGRWINAAAVYRLDYAIWDRGAQPRAGFDGLAGFEPIHEQGEFKVYRVLRP